VIVAGDGNNKIDAQAGQNYIKAGNGNNTILASDPGYSLHTPESNVSNVIMVGKGKNNITVTMKDSYGDGATIETSNDSNLSEYLGGVGKADGGNVITTAKGADEIRTRSGDDQIKTGLGSDVVNAGSGKNAIDLGDNYISKSLGNIDIDTDAVVFDTDFFAALNDANGATAAFNTIKNFKSGDALRFSNLEYQKSSDGVIVVDASGVALTQVAANFIDASEVCFGDLKTAGVQANYQLILQKDGKLYYDPTGTQSGTSDAVQIGAISLVGVTIDQLSASANGDYLVIALSAV